MKIKQSDLSFIENTKSCVFAEYCANDYYWERGSDSLLVSDSLSRKTIKTVYIDSQSAVAARKAIVSLINGKSL